MRLLLLSLSLHGAEQQLSLHPYIERICNCLNTGTLPDTSRFHDGRGMAWEGSRSALKRGRWGSSTGDPLIDISQPLSDTRLCIFPACQMIVVMHHIP